MKMSVSILCLNIRPALEKVCTKQQCINVPVDITKCIMYGTCSQFYIKDTNYFRSMCNTRNLAKCTVYLFTSHLWTWFKLYFHKDINNLLCLTCTKHSMGLMLVHTVYAFEYNIKYFWIVLVQFKYIYQLMNL